MKMESLLFSLYEEAYADSYRIGLATANYKVVGRILKDRKPAYYKENKHKIMRMSELQAKKAIDYLLDVFRHDNDVDESVIAAFFEEL